MSRWPYRTPGPHSSVEKCADCGAHCFAPLCGACHTARLTRERDDLRAEVTRLTRELEEARSVLREVEWTGYEGEEGFLSERCPSCEAPARGAKHAPDCRLAAVLEPRGAGGV